MEAEHPQEDSKQNNFGDKEPLSFIVDHNRVTPKEGVTPETPGKTRPSGRGGGQLNTSKDLVSPTFPNDFLEIFRYEIC